MHTNHGKPDLKLVSLFLLYIYLSILYKEFLSFLFFLYLNTSFIFLLSKLLDYMTYLLPFSHCIKEFNFCFTLKETLGSRYFYSNLWSIQLLLNLNPFYFSWNFIYEIGLLYKSSNGINFGIGFHLELSCFFYIKVH